MHSIEGNVLISCIKRLHHPSATYFALGGCLLSVMTKGHVISYTQAEVFYNIFSLVSTISTGYNNGLRYPAGLYLMISNLLNLNVILFSLAQSQMGGG